jgi:DNA-binding HxlR family transcriptional regulator
VLNVHATSQDRRIEGHQTETHAELVPDDRGRTSRPEAECPVEVALAAISGRWKTLVLRELMTGPHSFSDLREALPELSAKVLTERLTELLDQGLVMRDTVAGFPVRTSYQLTATGRELRPLLVELYRTGSALVSM